jgi:beta-glucosidase
LFTSDGPSRQNGLNAEYFSSGNFDGQAHRPRELTVPTSGKTVGQIPANPQPLFTRIDAQVDFNWWDGAPREDMNDDDFGVRWTGYLAAPGPGTYQLGAVAVNAFELYMDDKLVVRGNTIHSRNYQYAPVELQPGKLYKIRLDYHEFVGDAGAQLVWSQPVAPRDPEALAAARQADAVVLVLGLSPRLEGEEMRVRVEGFQGGDRVDIGIPAVQEELMRKVAALGKPLVLVLLNGSAVAVNWARDHVPAIVEAWYPGQAGGTALADVLFGDYNPAGRLPVTFYKSADQLPPFTDYSMMGKTYRFFAGQPLFPFGYGLSYTTFAYRNLSLPRQAAAGDPVTVSVEVANTGSRAGEEVVQLYVKTPSEGAPLHSLEGFQRVSLGPKERKQVQFTLSPRQLSSVTAEGRRVIEPGVFELSVGGKQPGAGVTGVLTGKLTIVGAAKELE